MATGRKQKRVNIGSSHETPAQRRESREVESLRLSISRLREMNDALVHHIRAQQLELVELRSFESRRRGEVEFIVDKARRDTSLFVSEALDLRHECDRLTAEAAELRADLEQLRLTHDQTMRDVVGYLRSFRTVPVIAATVIKALGGTGMRAVVAALATEPAPAPAAPITAE